MRKIPVVLKTYPISNVNFEVVNISVAVMSIFSRTIFLPNLFTFCKYDLMNKWKKVILET